MAATLRIIREPVRFAAWKTVGSINAESAALVFDFHSLRHTSGALLALAGIPPKVAQAVMRYSTINLTMDT